jgi:glutamine synthetase
VTTTTQALAIDRALSPTISKTITSVRLMYPDLHGVARGKDMPAAEFDHVVEHGLCFCAAVMGTDLRHTPVVGGEQGYPDLVARPDLSTLITLPWEPGVACCLADLEPATPDSAIADPRGTLRRVVERVCELGFEPIVGPELEFFLVVRDPAAPNGIRRHVDNLSMVYTVGPQADPGGIVRKMTEDLSALGLRVFAVNHEFMNSQYEINLRHSGAVDAADRAFRLKAAVKDIAALHGLAATFMGRPFNDQGGSGTHLHVSLSREERNVFDGAGGAGTERGTAPELGAFTAGVLRHAASLMAFLNPTINAYRRILPDSLAPTHANWGWDNRATFIRIPPERGSSTRIELRVGDGAANPYLAIAAVLLAGAEGIREKLVPPAPVEGDAYRADPSVIGEPLPQTLEAALDALERDELLCQGLGEPIVSTFLQIKRFELGRHRAWVSDWEIAEYLHHL